MKKQYRINMMFLGSMLIMLNLWGCGSCSDPKKGGGAQKSDKVQQTTVSYEINLDKYKLVKKEGNTMYYKVPVGTEVVITANVAGPEDVSIGWNQKSSGTSMTLNKQGKTTWKHKANAPCTIEVSGRPRTKKTVNGVDLITNEEKAFVIKWE